MGAERKSAFIYETDEVRHLQFQKPPASGLTLTTRCQDNEQGSPLRPFRRVLLCPLSIPKFTILHGIGCSLSLNIVLLLFFCFLEVSAKACWLWASNRSAKLAAVGPSAVTKSPNFWAGKNFPPPPLNKHNRFQHTVPSHIKSCTAHCRWEGGPREKARLFVTEGIWQRKPRFNKQGLYAWLWSGHLSILCTMPVSNYLRKPRRDMWYQYQIIWWTQNLILHPGTLVRPTS